MELVVVVVEIANWLFPVPMILVDLLCLVGLDPRLELFARHIRTHNESRLVRTHYHFRRRGASEADRAVLQYEMQLMETGTFVFTIYR